MQVSLQKKEYHGRTVFGIVSRAIRPRRRGCDGDYLRVCRQRRVEFGASSLELFFLFLFLLLRFVCVGESLVSRVVHLSFLSLVSSLGKETDGGVCVLVVVLIIALQVKPSPKSAKKH